MTDQQKKLSNKDEGAIYRDGSYLEMNPTWHEEDSEWKAGHVLKLFALNGLAPKTICETGCGSGALLRVLAGELGDGVACTGYDISTQAFEIIKKKRCPI